jgi:hypothetical protein
VSFFFYVPEQIFHVIGKDLASLFTPVIMLVRRLFLFCCDANILIYNFDIPEEVHRNSAMFWEPGAFAAFILLALVFLGICKDAYSKRFYKTRFFVLTIALLTSLSTMGYVGYLVVLGLHGYWPKAKTVAGNLGWIFVFILATPLVMVAIGKVLSLDFMGKKITAQYERATTRSEPSWHQSRFGGVVWRVKYIERRPMFGWGLNPQTRYALDPSDQFKTAGGDGISDFVHGFGFVGFGIFAIAAWKGLHALSGNSLFRSSVAFAVILLILVGQKMLYYPLFLGLMFLDKRYRNPGTGSASRTRDTLHDGTRGRVDVGKAEMVF